MRFNNFLNSHFKVGGCRLIARAHDACRDRRVEIFAMPGYHDLVGVSDGTDAWVAPSLTGPFFRTATGDVADIMRRLQVGEDLPPVPDFPGAAKRSRVALEDEETKPRLKRARTQLEADEEPTPRRTRREIL